MEQTKHERTNSMNQEIVKEILDSEGNQTHYGKLVSKSNSTTKVNNHTIITGVTELAEEDYFSINLINVQGANKDGDLRIRTQQTVVLNDEEGNIFSSTQNLVITREDAKSLIQQLTSYL
jgi:hypothetical protein